MEKIKDSPISFEMFVSHWLDKDQVRIIQQDKHIYIIKCGRKLSTKEVMGAIVKFHLAGQLKLK